jgi:hypothetical protein
MKPKTTEDNNWCLGFRLWVPDFRSFGFRKTLPRGLNRTAFFGKEFENRPEKIVSTTIKSLMMKRVSKTNLGQLLQIYSSVDSYDTTVS